MQHLKVTVPETMATDLGECICIRRMLRYLPQLYSKLTGNLIVGIYTRVGSLQTVVSVVCDLIT